MRPLIATITFSFLLLLLTGCGIQDATQEEAEQQHESADIMVLARVNGCRRCHRVKTSVVGPAWELISERYKDSPDAKAFLMDKVKRGGSGNWDDITAGAAMPPHEGRISDMQLERLIDYILSLKRDAAS